MGNFIDKGRVKRKNVFLGYQDGTRGLISSAGVSASTGAGDAPEAEASTLSAVGLHMDAADEHDWFWSIPNDLNSLHPIYFRVKYSSASATAADDRHWIILYDMIAEDAAMAIGTTALSTAIAAELDNGTANAWQWSALGTLNGAVVTEAHVTGGAYMAINLELDIDDADEEMNMYGIEISYVPKRGEGASQTYNADSATY